MNEDPLPLTCYPLFRAEAWSDIAAVLDRLELDRPLLEHRALEMAPKPEEIPNPRRNRGATLEA